MRFPQVPVGRRFQFEGKLYTKTGPLTASEEGSGALRMVPRSAEVTPLDIPDQPARPFKSHLGRAETREALQAYKVELAERLKALADADGSLRLEQVLALIDDGGTAG